MPNYDVLYLRGSLMNVLARALTVTPSNADSLFPIAQLYNGKTDEPFKFGSNAADRLWTADNNYAVNGGFETSTLDGWTDASTGTGTIAEETSLVASGSNALNCDGNASGIGKATRDYTVAAGERLTVSVAIRGTVAASAVAKFQVYNPRTQKYLTSGAAWTSTPTDLFTDADDTYTTNTLAFQVEDFDTCQADTVPLRIICYCDDNGSAYFDDIVLFPTINWISVHGHNVSPGVALELHSSTDNFSGSDTTEATLTAKQPACFAYLSTPVARRYWRLKVSGTNDATPYMSAVLGYAETLTAKRAFGRIEVGLMKDQVRNVSQSMHQHVTAVGGAARRVLKWGFQAPRPAGAIELRDEILQRSRFGELPIVVAQRDSDTDQVVVHGRVPPEWGWKQNWVASYDAGLEVVEDPFPSVLS